MKKLVLGIVISVFFGCLSLSGVASAASKEQNENKPQITGHMYGIGSVSKMYTAAAVMKLTDENWLDLDTPIVNYIPEFIMEDPRYEDITPRMLLNHSSGLMGMTGNNAMLVGDNDTGNHDHFLEYLSTQRLKSEPGSISVYSNDSFTLSEILVERVSGLSFTEFLDRYFAQPLNLTSLKTPQSDFDRALLAPTYLNGYELNAETFNVIGSGGIYSSMEDLCRFSTIFMNSADESILSRTAVNEMAADQHRTPMVSYDSDTTFRYGLGWDCVNTYPFNTLGIKAVSKGGDTGKYHTNLTVLPEYNLAAAVSSSSSGGAFEQSIAQEIILAVLQEEGLINEVTLELPKNNISAAVIPESLKLYEGIYDTGAQGYLLDVRFSDDQVLISSLGTVNDHTQTYQYTQNEEFLSVDGDYIWLTGLSSAAQGTRGTTKLQFSEDNKGSQFIIVQSYQNTINLSQSAFAAPIAQKLNPNEIPLSLEEIWRSRSEKTYLLTSERYSSGKYCSSPIARIAVSDVVSGYVGGGLYYGPGENISYGQIVDETTVCGWQSIPTMSGRDAQKLTFGSLNGMDVLNVNNYRFISEDALQSASEIKGTVHTGQDTVWYRIDETVSGQQWSISVPPEASYFVYDEEFNVLASSLESQERAFIILPQNGYIAFAGNDADFKIAFND